MGVQVSVFCDVKWYIGGEHGADRCLCRQFWDGLEQGGCDFGQWVDAGSRAGHGADVIGHGGMWMSRCLYTHLHAHAQNVQYVSKFDVLIKTVSCQNTALNTKRVYGM